MSFQYQTAARIIEAAEKGKALKSFCASIDNLRKSDYALAMQTLKYTEVIKEILTTVEDEELANVKKSLLHVMMYEFLFGKGKIQGGGLVKRKIMEHNAAFLSAKETKMQGKQHHDELLSNNMKEAQELPTYVRINEAMLSINKGLEMIQQNYAGAELDDLVPSLVKLPKDSKGISQAEYIADGKCVLQDKASCFPSQILFNQYKQDLQTHRIHPHSSQQQHTYFIDACSAPGNKTSHLAALLLSHHRSSNNLQQNPKTKKNRPTSTAPESIPATIYACDKSADRAKLLKRRMQQYAVDGIMKIKQQDFMAIDVQESTEHYESIEYVLLDPSCSGSGIVRNIERVIKHENEDDGDGTEDNRGNKDRVLKLQAFQTSILQKALSFPNVHTVVYSTCSIHEEENEQVVVKTLQSALGQNWHLIAPIGFESWTRRGHVIDGLSPEDAAKLIRCLPSDGMNGFFVALFQRNAGITAKDIPAYVPSLLPTNQSNTQQKDKRKFASEATDENKSKPKQKRSLDAIVDNSQEEKTAAKKSKHEEVSTVAKKEKHPKKMKQDNSSSGSTSLFAPRFQVSKTTKRNFHKRK